MLSGYARENSIYARHNRMAPISTHPYTFLLHHHFSHQVVDNSTCAHIMIGINSTLFPWYQNSIQYCVWGPMASPSLCDPSFSTLTTWIGLAGFSYDLHCCTTTHLSYESFSTCTALCSFLKFLLLIVICLLLTINMCLFLYVIFLNNRYTCI